MNGDSPSPKTSSTSPSSPPDEFEAIVRRTQTRIRAYIAGMGAAPHDVDDIAQDVYIEFYRNFDRIPPNVAPERWLKGIARNLCMNFFRRTARRARLHHLAIAELLLHAERKPDWIQTDDDLGEALQGCYETLPAESKRMLVMRYQHELASADIARRVNSTAQAVRVALHRIRAKLKDCIFFKLAAEQPAAHDS